EEHRIVSNGIKIQVKDANSIDRCVGQTPVNVKHNPQDVVDGLVVGDGSIRHFLSNEKKNEYWYNVLDIRENDGDYFDSEIVSYIGEIFDGGQYHINTTISKGELPLTYNRTIPDRFFYGDTYKVAGF